MNMERSTIRCNEESACEGEESLSRSRSRSMFGVAPLYTRPRLWFEAFASLRPCPRAVEKSRGEQPFDREGGGWLGWAGGV